MENQQLDPLEATLAASKNKSSLSRSLRASLLKSQPAELGPESALLDLSAAATGYIHAAVPAAEAEACYQVFCGLVEYMRLRANPVSEMDDTAVADKVSLAIRNVVEYTLRLYGEYVSNTTSEVESSVSHGKSPSVHNLSAAKR